MGPVNYLGAMGVLPDPAASIRAGLENSFLERGMQQEQQLRDLQIQQAQAAQQVQGQFQKDVDGLLTDPSPEGYAAMFAKYPSFQKALAASWETRDKAAKETDLRELSGIYAAGQSGRWEVAASALRRRIEADRAAGQDTTEDEEALRIAETGTPEEKRALLGMTGVQLAATLGPDKFTEAYKELNPNAVREGKVVDKFLLDPVTGAVRFQAPTDPKYMNVDGNLVEIPGAPGVQGGGFASFYSDFLAPAEGGFVASDGRSGAPANFGVNQAANPDVDVASLSQEQAAQLLHDRYWVPSGADKIKNPALQAVHADTAVNMGVETAKRMLDRSGGDPNKYLQLRESRYKSLGGPDLPGWLNRNQRLREYVGNEVPARSGGSPKVLFSKPKEEGYTQLTPQEVSALGLPVGTVAQRGPNGKIDVINKGDAADAPYSQSALDAFDRAIGSANRLLEHPGFDSAVGMKGLSGGLLGGWTVPGTDAANFNAELEAMKAQVFLPMVQSMKGMGQLSNAEGQKLTDAIGALDTKMSEGAFESSLKRIIGDLTTYRNRGAGKDGAKSPDLSNGGILSVRTAEEYNALPPGSEYRDPQGNLRRKR